MLPGGHGVHAVLPGEAAVVTGAQATGAADADAHADPMGHELQPASPSAEYEPSAQPTGLLAGSRHEEPAGQSMQAGAPAGAYVPSPHPTGLASASGQACPAGHCAHVVRSVGEPIKA